MTKVFIGGSRRVSRLIEPIRMRLDRIIEKGLPVIIGDANGADKAVQQYLDSKNYLNVEVFCSGNVCRNNVGNWKERKVLSTARNKTFDFYAAKDRTMADEATVGFMMWDGKSKGTILNVFRLMKREKKAVVYNVAEKRFYELKTLAQWEEFISRCDGELRNKVEQQAALEDQECGSLSPQSFKPSMVATQAATWTGRTKARSLLEQIAAPSVKLQFAAIRMLFDWLVVSQVVPANPASSVRGARHVVSSGTFLRMELLLGENATMF